MSNKSPSAFLTAQWRNLILLTYAVPPEVLTPLLPPHCELESIDNRAFVSLVAFDFRQTRVLGIACPGHTDFPEINLRFYVRCHGVPGVVFIRELVRRRLVAWVARLFYNEPYLVVPMHSEIEQSADSLAVRHALRFGGRDYSIRVTADADIQLPPPSQADYFFKEHRWGFGTSRSGQLLQYRVDHPTWETHRIRSVQLDWNWQAIYGPRWAFLQNQEPCSTILAAGSAVSLSLKVRRMAPTAPQSESNSHPLILFDGVCGLCDRLVTFVIDRDPAGVFHFAPLQSPQAQQMLAETCGQPANPGDLSSVVLIDDGRVYRHSTAALRILRRLSPPLAAAAWVALLFPGPLRDGVYRWIARNRYRWFGKRDACRLPSPETADRFLA